MPLTPADVHNVAFKKPSIGKRGYDEDEVDAFLDVVEAELARLIEENAELKGKADAVAGGHTVPLTKAPAPAEAAMSTGEAHTAAARLLGLAQETADKLTGEARAEADRVTLEATEQAERTVADAKSQAEALLSDASARAEATERESQAKAETLDREAKTRYDETIGKLTTDRVGLEKKIEDLRGYEKEYRGRLKSWISEQLAQLEDGGSREQKPVAVTSGPGD